MSNNLLAPPTPSPPGTHVSKTNSGRQIRAHTLRALRAFYDGKTCSMTLLPQGLGVEWAHMLPHARPEERDQHVSGSSLATPSTRLNTI